MNCSSTFHKGPCESYYDKLGEIRAVLEQVVMDEKDKVVENEVEGTGRIDSHNAKCESLVGFSPNIF